MSPTGKPSILVVDDSVSIRTFLHITLQNLGYQVREAENAAEGLAFLTPLPKAIILDLGLPDRDGLDLLTDIRLQAPDVPVIILTVRNDSSTRHLAFERGANSYVSKPFQMEDLLEELERVINATH